MEIKNRNVAVCIILSIVTVGIYAIYWFIKMTDESNALAPNNTTTSGGKAFLLTLVTCGIYGIYWFYKLGNKVGEMSGGNDQGVLYLVLTILGLGIIPQVMAQLEINKHANC